MPSVNYYNRSAPFWDFIASLEEQGSQHPMFGNRSGENADNENNDSNNNNNNPWMQGWGPFGGPFVHRGRPGWGPHGHHHGPPPPQPPAEQDTEMNTDNEEVNEKEGEAGPSEAPKDGPSTRGSCPSARGRGNGCGSRGRGGWGSRGHGHHGGPPRGPSRGFHPMMGGFGNMAQMFQEQLFGDAEANKNNKEEDFTPEADVFDTAEAFVVHVSLPGAKKEDVGVNWDAEKSELSVAGVVYRPGEEEFLKTLAMNERKVGAFERKVRLGSRANPAQVDVDGITARMEDGVLTVEVPKLDSGYVEIKKVDIE